MATRKKATRKRATKKKAAKKKAALATGEFAAESAVLENLNAQFGDFANDGLRLLPNHLGKSVGESDSDQYFWSLVVAAVYQKDAEAGSASAYEREDALQAWESLVEDSSLMFDLSEEQVVALNDRLARFCASSGLPFPLDASAGSAEPTRAGDNDRLEGGPIEADTRKIATLLRSEDWEQCQEGYELYGSLGDRGPAVLETIDDALLGLSESPKEIKIRVRAAESEKETVRYSARDEKWEGWVEHYGKTTVEIDLKSDDAEGLAWVAACLKADRWNSDVPVNQNFSDEVRGQGDSFFHLDAKGNTREGEPETSKGNTSDVSREYLESVDYVYEDSSGFGATGCSLYIEGLEIAPKNMRSVLLALALLAAVDIGNLPVVPPTPELN